MQIKLTNSLAVLAVLCAAVVVAPPAHAQSVATSPFCTNQLIRGTYGFTIVGTKLGGPGGTGSQQGVAMASFDGHGGFAQIDAVTIAGTPVSDFTHPVATGTYQVNSDCTGTFTINFKDGRPAVNTSFVVVEGGFEIDTVVTSVVPPTGVDTTGLIATSSIGKRRFF
jgi:hypothetical protein